MTAAHVIADVKFQSGVDGREAPMECSCGWTGLVREFDAHRGPVSGSRGHVLGPSASRTPMTRKPHNKGGPKIVPVVGDEKLARKREQDRLAKQRKRAQLRGEAA